MKGTIYRTTKLLSSLAGMLMLTAVMMIGCNPNVTTPQPAKDSTPPAEVTNLQAVAGNGKISLSWTNPADADLHQVAITVQKEGETAVSTVYISAEKGKDSEYIIEGLAANTTYTVTVRTIDKALNKSKDGISTTVTTNAAGSVMSITLTQNPAKDSKTNGSVTVTVASSTSIKEAKWVKGVHSANDIFTSGTAISGNSFSVNENGIYSVAVLDNEGRREVKTIEIKNIDKTPPAPVSSLTVSYSSSSKKITVNWQNPPDSDFAGLTLSWKKGTGSETPVELTKDKTSYEISDIAPDDSTYTIAVTAKDDVGNTGTPVETTVKATETAEITAVMLTRTHFDTVQTDRNITVTVSGSNFDKLTSLKVQVKKDGGMAEAPVDAVINALNNKATAIVQAPVPFYPTDEGTRYTVKAIVNSTTPAAATASFIVSNPAKVSNIALTPDKLKLGSGAEKVSVAVTGTNFDIRGETKITLFNSDGTEVSTVTVDEKEGNETMFTAELTGLPSVIGEYTVAVFFKRNKQTETAQLQLYGAPEITSVSIPKAGTSYADNKLPVTIKGKNFTAPGANFSGSGASITNFTVVNDTTATAEVTCPYSAGEHTVTVMCGTESKIGTLSVKDYSTGYEVGKIVLANKALVDKDGYAIDPSNPPVGIICGSNSYKAPQMIALHTSGSDLVWAKDGSTGYNTKFEGIICTPSKMGSGAAQTATFTGDTDGSDNWAYICSIDPDGTANAAVNYSAFNWVNTYNTTYADKLGSARPSWYMPSIAELCEVYKKRGVINASLKTIHDVSGGSEYADESLGQLMYWSSSQDSYSNDCAWGVNFSDGYVVFYYKYTNFRVCCLSGF